MPENRPAPLFRAGSDRVLPGNAKLVIGQNPVAGADWVAQVPAGRKWRLLAGSADLVTSNAAANRSVIFFETDQSHIFFRSANASNQAASLTFHYSLVPGAFGNVTNAIDGVSLTGLPDLWLPGGFEIASNTFFIQAADQWQNIFLMVEELWQDDTSIELEREHHMEQLLDVLRQATATP